MGILGAFNDSLAFSVFLVMFFSRFLCVSCRFLYVLHTFNVLGIVRVFYAHNVTCLLHIFYAFNIIRRLRVFFEFNVAFHILNFSQCRFLCVFFMR